jgi:citrate synthase
MNETMNVKNTGLRGVTVASTKISDVQGDAGKLIYRGYLVQDLAANATFEEVAHLLLKEKLPTKAELSEFKAQLSAERHLPAAIITALKASPKNASPMDVLQAGICMLAQHDPDTRDFSRDAGMRMAIRLVAKVSVLVAAWQRIRSGQEPVPAIKELDHGANFMYMLTGKKPDPEVGRFMDTALVLHAEHSLNASTFAAREVASTKAHIYAATSAAVGSLSGELHGSANVRVMEMLLKIGDIKNIEPYVNQVLESGQKLMGLGHAIYKTDDPRSFLLAPMAQKMGERAGDTKWYEMAKRIEVVSKKAFKNIKGREIYVNVDFYSAPLYFAMGIPVDLFSSIFAVSRIAGWVAHVLEEQFADAAPKTMLYRPEAEYIGHYCGPEECSFTPMEQR